jgi:hypothetical protein
VEPIRPSGEAATWEGRGMIALRTDEPLII